MNQENMIRLKNAIDTLNYMATEVKLNMSKHIALSGHIGKYAIRHSVNPNMTIDFVLLNTDNGTTAMKIYTYEMFCKICSNVELLERTFTNLADDLMSAVDRESSEVIVINDSMIDFI